MSQERKDSVRLAKRLLGVSLASEQGLMVAAENVDHPALKGLYRGLAQERARMAGALRQAIGQGGDAEDTGGGLLAAAHRGWITIKAAMTIGADNVERMVLNEVLRGEQAALYAYETALRAGTTGAFQQLVVDQYDYLLEVHDRLEQLQDSGQTDLPAQRYDDRPAAQITAGAGQRHAVAETSLAGGLVGAGLGLLLSVVVVLSVWAVMGQPALAAADGALWSMALLTVAAPTIFGVFLGGIIGVASGEMQVASGLNFVELGGLSGSAELSGSA